MILLLPKRDSRLLLRDVKFWLGLKHKKVIKITFLMCVVEIFSHRECLTIQEGQLYEAQQP